MISGKEKREEKQSKVSTESKKWGKKAKQPSAGWVQGWGGIHGGLEYGFFQWAVVRWQAGDAMCWKAEVLQSSLQK